MMEVTASLLRHLAARAARGRLFAEQDGEPGQEQKIVLTYVFWQPQFGGREQAIGQSLRLNGTPHTVIGVLPQTFVFLTPEIKLWVPSAFSPADRSDEARHDNSYQ